VATERIAATDAFVVTIPRDEPYLGALREGEAPNAAGYFIRQRNRTVYPTVDRSVLIRVEAESGSVGWGETYGIVTPTVVVELVRDLLGPMIAGRDPRDPAVIHEDLYDLMRVRGYFGGFYLDALAGVDIALWDLAGKIADLPVARLLGGRRHDSIPAYVSGLPKPSLPERVAFAEDWIAKGFEAVKFAAAVTDEGEQTEMQALRRALGPAVKIMADLHWRYTAAEAVALIDALDEHDLAFAEAPVHPEDIEGLAEVARKARVPIAAGEEWRTVHEYRPRYERRCMSIVQPEMGRTGITEFVKIAHLAEAFHCRVIPHASIGVGIFMAASLQASSSLPEVAYHEYQHSIFDRNLRFVTGDMSIRDGSFQVPTGPGLGVEPSPEVWAHADRRQ
jgi:L-alanine-DL-glutamate epimerase-like enolase superfamily enzyme